MPYVSEKIKLPPELDRRRKLTEEDKEYMKFLYEKGYSIRGITRLMPVSRRRVQQILFPDRYERMLECRKARGGSAIYYNKDKHKTAMKEHRHYKHKLYVEGKIKKEDKND